MPNMFDIVRSCELQKQQKQQNLCGPVNYSKLVTGGNDPSISKAMRYSQYVQNAKPHTEYATSAAERLAAQGITFNPYRSPILVSLQFTNLKLFNMPREKTFSRN